MIFNKKLCYLLTIYYFASPAAVTYDFSGGRFGDCIMCYLHAKWISFKYKIPIIFKPFKYSDKLVMHYKELQFDNNINRLKRVIFKNESLINRNSNNLYVVPYFSQVE